MCWCLASLGHGRLMKHINTTSMHALAGPHVPHYRYTMNSPTTHSNYSRLVNRPSRCHIGQVQAAYWPTTVDLI